VKLPDGWPFILGTLAFVVWHYFLSAAALRQLSHRWRTPVDVWAGPTSRVLGGALFLAASIVGAVGLLTPGRWFAAPTDPSALLWVVIPASILVPVVWRVLDASVA
jgi:hypothetical protein